MWFKKEVDFVAVDRETANEDRASICQIGIAEFRNDRIVGEFESLVRDKGPFSLGSFHGINADRVKDAPTFSEVFPEIKKRLEGRLAVSHGNFDRGALRKACATSRLDELSCDWLDSVRIACRIWQKEELGNYKLDSVCRAI